MKKIALGVFCLLMMGCSNDLSRSNAQSIVSKNIKPLTAKFVCLDLPFNQKEMTLIGRSGYKQGIELSYQQLQQLKDEGYMTKSEFTDKASPFLIIENHPDADRWGGEHDRYYHLILANNANINMLGIGKPTQEEGYVTCYAHFTISYKLNELGEKLNLETNNLQRSATARFVKMDDGWRIKSIKYDES